MSLNVCHVSSTNVDGHYFADLCEGLASSGVRVLCGTLGRHAQPDWMGRFPHLSYFCLGATGRRAYPLAAFRLVNLLRREKIDLVQTHLFDAGLLGVVASRLARIPVVVHTRHHLDEHWVVGSRLHVHLDRLMANRADHVVVASEAVRRHMVEREGFDSDGIHVVPYGFDFEDLAGSEHDARRVRAELGLEDSFVIGCVARILPAKGHADLVAALAQLVSESVTHSRLLLVGDGELGWVREVAREWGVEDRVVFAGFRDDVPACMRAMDVLAHPTLSEGFGQVIIEAIAAGTPVVATGVGGIPELIVDGETGLLVPPHAPCALAQALLRLHDDPRLGERLAGEALARSRHGLSSERMVARHLELYERWLTERGDAGAIAST